MVYAVIMAGGVGSRFWPMSTRSTPKQFLKLFGDRTMIQTTVDRLSGLIPVDRCLVVTSEKYEQTVRNQLPSLQESHLIGEPVAKNTAPCIAAAAAQLYAMDPDAVMVVLPADHVISDIESFHRVLESAISTARKDDVLVTIGIEPDHPETGYGYIRYETTTPDPDQGKLAACQVTAFTEKPELEMARKFLESGDYLWNSGMFVWRADVVLEAFKKHQPEIYRLAKPLLSSSAGRAELETFYKSCPSVSVDYGIMEKMAGSVKVVPGDFGWNDVGLWKAVHELSDKDSDGNTRLAEQSIVVNSHNNYIHSESGKMIALVGIDGVAVVETDDAILICRLDDSQDVKKVVEQIESDEQLKKYL